MYTIQKEFHFCASHALQGLPKEHKCSRLHGHNYVVIFTLDKDRLDETGFVEDYGNLKDISAYIDNNMDHRFLASNRDQADKYNVETEAFILGVQSSAENMARFFYEKFKSAHPYLVSVSVSETNKTWATYKPEQETIDEKDFIGLETLKKLRQSVPKEYFDNTFSKMNLE